MTHLLAESLLHSSTPFALRMGSGFGIRWYGLAYAAGFLVAWLLMRWMSVTRRSPMSRSQVSDFLTWAVLGVIVGGRVGHVIFYDHALLWTFTSEFPFWGLLFIHKGGMSSHGGIIGVVIAVWWWCRRNQMHFTHLTDLTAWSCCIGLGLGRYANWINGELWGKPLPVSMQAESPWWSVKYPEELLRPGVISESTLLLLKPLVPASSATVAAGMQVAPISVTGAIERGNTAEMLYAACYGGDVAVRAKVAQYLVAYYPNNFLQAISDGVVLFALLSLVWLKPRKPGVITGWFFLGYGTLRLATEQLREIDPGVFMIGPATLPMLLSMAMMAGGVVICIASSRRAMPTVGGLLRTN
ncbi:MAG: prolipoprotein diacylglyceryl transferase [Planctomycetes bacterium]|nr:prolipoprotein diacylglyceryl transferase [Planctomycetota bacterium]